MGGRGFMGSKAMSNRHKSLRMLGPQVRILVFPWVFDFQYQIMSKIMQILSIPKTQKILARFLEISRKILVKIEPKVLEMNHVIRLLDYEKIQHLV